MAPIKTVRNILMELRKICQHPYISEPELESFDIPEVEQHKQLIEASGKLMFLKLLLPKLKERGHRVLLFSQFKIALDRIEDFLYGEEIKFLRLDGDVQQAQRQKSMDLFNAPNSDYDVFLLTTRAGGVGINLATADTVILYDPDFNPHQDLQAIARSHRYGQKKKVLVFKLMVKGSVEENIINKGKKKMVLDHLVVQQMGKEAEEGDIDDLLLRGAEAVYSNQGGINVPDIVYNSKNVDELIDKVEADAEQEAQEMADREKAIAEGTAEVKKKTNQQFGFAKIWEADQNQLLDIANNEEDIGEEGRETNWESIIEIMEKERQNKLQELIGNTTKKKRKATEKISFQDHIDGVLEDKTPEKKKLKSKKGKSRAILKGSSVSGSGSEYDTKINGGNTSESEDFSDAFIPEELQGLDLPGTSGQASKQYSEIVPQQHARHIAQSSHLPTVPGPNGNPLDQAFPMVPSVLQPANGISAGPSNARQQKEEEKLRKPGRPRKEKRGEKLPHSNIDINNPSHTHSSSAYPPTTNHHHQQRYNPLVNQKLAEARHILNLLYSVLKEFGDSKSIRRWALITLPELPPAERADRYKILAEETDNHLTSMRQAKYFSLPNQVKIVSTLFLAKAPGVIEGNLDVPPIPHNVGMITSPQPRIAAPATAAPAPRIRKRDRTPASDVNVADQTPGPPHQHQHQMIQPSKSSEDLFNSLMNSAPSSCKFCSGPHELKECQNISSMEDLNAITKAIIGSNDDELGKTIALKNVEKMRKLLIQAGKAPYTPVAPLAGPSSNLSVQNTITPSNSIILSQSTNSKLSTPIRNPQVQPSTSASTVKKSHHNHILTREIIEIPDSPPPLPLPTPAPDPIIPTVNHAEQLCSFCEKSCGLPIRNCIEKNGDRKSLKLKIRNCEEKLQKGDGSERIRKIQQTLYEVYKEWPREKK